MPDQLEQKIRDIIIENNGYANVSRVSSAIATEVRKEVILARIKQSELFYNVGYMGERSISLLNSVIEKQVTNLKYELENLDK